jgi:cell wall-associated NlpC family hydrolase
MTLRRTTRCLVSAAVPVLLAAVLTAGCAHAPAGFAEGPAPDAGGKAAAVAAGLIGRPYRYRGESPSGFDCSGLVRYSYRAAGIEAPHGTRALTGVTRPVGGLLDARPGDLLFFSQRGRPYSHVGIYVGEGQFVHAPSAGGRVRRDSMSDPYWQEHYLEVRRFP